MLALQRQPLLASKHAKRHLSRNPGKVVHEFRGVLVLAVDVLETLQHQRQRAEQENAKYAGDNYICDRLGEVLLIGGSAFSRISIET